MLTIQTMFIGFWKRFFQNRNKGFLYDILDVCSSRAVMEEVAMIVKEISSSSCTVLEQ